MKKGYKTTLIIIAILLAVSLIWFFGFRKKEQTVVLEIQTPATGYISQNVTATGTIQPVDTVAVGTQVSGTIKYVYADFNSKVKKGELVAQLDKSLLQASADQIIANLQTAKSQLLYQKNNFERQKLLYKTDAISKADYDAAVNTYNAAVASVSSTEAQLRLTQKNLSYADIYSPIDGVVLSRSISPGQTVAASFSTPTLFVIAKDITKMQVQANVDEADIGNVSKNQRVSFTVDAFIDDSFNGTVQEVRLHPRTSANVVTYTTIINAPNQDMKLKPGMTANVIIYTKEVKNAMLVPAKALQFTPDSTLDVNHFDIKPLKKEQVKEASGNMTGSHAQRSDSTGVVSGKAATIWLKKGNMLLQKQVTIGLNDNTHVEVLAGLSATDSVINGVQPAALKAPSGGVSFFPRPGGARKPK